MICDSFEYNRNPIDIIGSTTVTITQKMKYTAIIIEPFIMAFGFAVFSFIFPVCNEINCILLIVVKANSWPNRTVFKGFDYREKY